MMVFHVKVLATQGLQSANEARGILLLSSEAYLALLFICDLSLNRLLKCNLLASLLTLLSRDRYNQTSYFVQRMNWRCPWGFSDNNMVIVTGKIWSLSAFFIAVYPQAGAARISTVHISD
jgi:hypothetical protein